jgi:hypothetical protein
MEPMQVSAIADRWKLALKCLPTLEAGGDTDAIVESLTDIPVLLYELEAHREKAVNALLKQEAL